MDIEYEAAFFPVDKNAMRKLLSSKGANLVTPEYLQKRTAFHLPKGHELKGGWVRVRQEAEKVTLSVKIVDGNKIENKREICLEVDDYKKAELMLETLGCRKKAYQENKREVWKMDDVEITIDEWPYLEPYIEIEGSSEKSIKKAVEKLGLDWGKAIFHSVDYMYHIKYGVAQEIVYDKTPRITFFDPNPFLK